MVLPISIAKLTIKERRMAKFASSNSRSSLRIVALAMAGVGTFYFPDQRPEVWKMVIWWSLFEKFSYSGHQIDNLCLRRDASIEQHV